MGGVRIDASQLNGGFLNGVDVVVENDRDLDVRKFSIVGVEDEVGGVLRLGEADGVDDIAVTTEDGAFSLVDASPSGGNESALAVDVDQPGAAEVTGVVAVGEAVAVGAQPVAVAFLAIFAIVHGQRIFASGLFKLNRDPHGLTSQVDRLVEGSRDPIHRSRRVDSLFSEELTRLVAKSLTVDTEDVVVVGGHVGVHIELGGGNLHTHGSASISGGRQADTKLTGVGVV